MRVWIVRHGYGSGSVWAWFDQHTRVVKVSYLCGFLTLYGCSLSACFLL